MKLSRITRLASLGRNSEQRGLFRDAYGPAGVITRRALVPNCGPVLCPPPGALDSREGERTSTGSAT